MSRPAGTAPGGAEGSADPPLTDRARQQAAHTIASRQWRAALPRCGFGDPGGGQGASCESGKAATRRNP